MREEKEREKKEKRINNLFNTLSKNGKDRQRAVKIEFMFRSFFFSSVVHIIIILWAWMLNSREINVFCMILASLASDVSVCEGRTYAIAKESVVVCVAKEKSSREQR